MWDKKKVGKVGEVGECVLYDIIVNKNVSQKN